MLFQGVDYFDCSIGAIISVVLIVRILLIDLLFWFSPIAFGNKNRSAIHPHRLQKAETLGRWQSIRDGRESLGPRHDYFV